MSNSTGNLQHSFEGLSTVNFCGTDDTNCTSSSSLVSASPSPNLSGLTDVNPEHVEGPGDVKHPLYIQISVGRLQLSKPSPELIVILLRMEGTMSCSFCMYSNPYFQSVWLMTYCLTQVSFQGLQWWLPRFVLRLTADECRTMCLAEQSGTLNDSPLIVELLIVHF